MHSCFSQFLTSHLVARVGARAFSVRPLFGYLHEGFPWLDSLRTAAATKRFRVPTPTFERSCYTFSGTSGYHTSIYVLFVHLYRFIYSIRHYTKDIVLRTVVSWRWRYSGNEKDQMLGEGGHYPRSNRPHFMQFALSHDLYQ